jgi:hypothetical protein
MPQEQIVELYVPRVVAYKQTDVKNQLLISWRKEILWPQKF